MGRTPLALAVFLAPIIHAQSQRPPDPPGWQTAAGGKMAFEVAAIKLDTGPFRPPSFPLDDGNAYAQTGGQFSADFPLLVYIQFAYKIRFSQEQLRGMLTHLPRWMVSDRYDIQARAEHPVTKDQMRLMMQSLLADRFHLTAHFETQETPVLALVPVKPGKTGPNLRPHSEGPPCEDQPAAPQASRPADGGVYPAMCYVQELNGKSDHTYLAGSRNTTMDQLAEVVSSLGRLDRVVVDRTGLTGGIDYRLEWSQEPNAAAAPNPDPQLDAGPTFLEAIRDQLGLKLESVKAPLRVLVIDQVERPSEN